MQAALRRHGTLISSIEDEVWTSSEALRELHGTLGVADLAGFGVDPQAVGTRAAGAALRYGRDLSGGSRTTALVISNDGYSGGCGNQVGPSTVTRS